MNILSPSDIEQLLDHDPSQAEQQLAILLSSGVEPAELSQLAAKSFAQGRFGMASMIFAAWTQRVPGDPEPWSNLGLCLAQMRQAKEARAVLEHALSLRPDFAAARNNLCSVYQHLGMHVEQLENARTALALQPVSALAHNNLGSALLDSGQTAEAKQAFLQSLAVAPENFEASFNLTRIAIDEGRYKEAMQFLEAARSTPAYDSPAYRDMIDYHLAYAYLAQGRLSEGWALYERGFSPLISPTIARRPDRQFAAPRWDGMPLAAGQRLLVWREQGIGDELRFLALLPQADIGKGQLIIETEPRFIAMLRRAFPLAEVRAPGAGTTGAHDIDFHLPIGSLPSLVLHDERLFGKLGGYLSAMPAEIERFRARLNVAGSRPKVGICWRSHLQGGARQKKYTALRDWAPLLTMPGLDFVSLQYGDCEDEVRAAEQEFGIHIRRWADVDLKNDLEAVLGLMHHLDVVISPSTAVVPLAGASGRPTIFIGHPSWIMLGEHKRYPWFSSVTPVIAAPDRPVASVLPQLPALVRETLGLPAISR